MIPSAFFSHIINLISIVDDMHVLLALVTPVPVPIRVPFAWTGDASVSVRSPFAFAYRRLRSQTKKNDRRMWKNILVPSLTTSLSASPPPPSSSLSLSSGPGLRC